VVGYYGSDDNTYNGYYVKEESPITTARDLIEGRGQHARRPSRIRIA
jgi:hypothetical protein